MKYSLILNLETKKLDIYEYDEIIEKIDKIFSEYNINLKLYDLKLID